MKPKLSVSGRPRVRPAVLTDAGVAARAGCIGRPRPRVLRRCSETAAWLGCGAYPQASKVNGCTSGARLHVAFPQVYGSGMQEINIPKPLYDDLVKSGAIKSDFFQADSVHVPVQGLDAFNAAIKEGPPNVYHPQGAVMSPGDRVEGIITRVEPYGLYLTHDGEVVLVLAPDVSPKRPLDLPSVYAVGDRLVVRILRYITEKSIYKGTVVENPESEPAK